MKTDDAGTSTGRALVAIGTNVPFHDLAGPALVAAALRRLDDEGLAPLAVSTCRTTEAWPDPSDPPFTNAAALLHAPGLPAQAVLQVLLRVEAAFGRIRSERNAPRTLDLDLLDLDGRSWTRWGWSCRTRGCTRGHLCWSRSRRSPPGGVTPSADAPRWRCGPRSRVDRRRGHASYQMCTRSAGAT
jgi:2-amino-4-hydroxy-6-hydroxymethyldihydropteridine diphosphokinase